MVDKYNILVVGSDGQLGNSIKFFSNEFDNYNFHFTNKNQLDISNYKSIEKYLIISLNTGTNYILVFYFHNSTLTGF